jgi:hypothetical protein
MLGMVMSKIKCHKCGQYHDWGKIEVVFKYPDVYFDIPEGERIQRIKKNNEICVIDDKDYFLRGLLPIKTNVDNKEEYRWGVWIKVDAGTYKRIYDSWDLENQEHLIGLKGYLANEIAFYEETEGKDVRIVLTGNKTRPKFYFTKDNRLIKIQSTKIDTKDLLDIYHFHFDD